MKKITYLFLISLTLYLILPISFVSAQVKIDNVKLSVPKGGQITISWTSDQACTSYIYFGQAQNDLSLYIGNLEYKYKHEAVLSGLKRDQDYYYKIQVKNQSGQVTETFVNYFNTKGMAYTTSPDINNFKFIQSIDRAAAFSWQTNRDTRFDFYYGLESDDLKFSHKSRTFQKNFFLVIDKNLKAGEKYYYRLVAIDRDGNQRTQFGSFNTRQQAVKQIEIINLKPTANNELPIMPEKAIISWQSNIIASSEIIYSSDPNRLSSRFKVNSQADTNHYALLENLKPNTVYYYKIIMDSPLSKLKRTSQLYSFKTAPLNQDYLGLYWQSGDIVSYRKNTYLIYQDFMMLVNDNTLVDNLSKSQDLKEIDNKYLEAYSKLPAYYGPFHDGQVVKETNKNIVYLIDGQYRRPIANWSVFTYLNYQASDIKTISQSDLRRYKSGSEIKHSHDITGADWGKKLNNQLVKTKDQNTVYLIVNNQKLPILNEASFNRRGFSFKQVIEINQSVLNQFRLGQVII
jgi:hypothetical protein